MSRFLERLRSPAPVILDGGTGTELLRRGYRTALPLWSAGALVDRPALVAEIHADYVRSGAELVSANTFRTNPRTLRRAGLEARARELNALAVRLARDSGAPFVAGSIAPLEDCYRPDLVPSRAEALAEHGAMARMLAEAGCDVLLVETMNTIAEAAAAVEAARPTGLPLLVSFVCGPDGRLLSGEGVDRAAKELSLPGVAALMVNCSPLASIPPALRALRRGSALPIGAYANVGTEDPEVGWKLTGEVGPEPYARAVKEWIALGATLVGGCCGTTPEHVARLATGSAKEQPGGRRQKDGHW